MNDSQKTPVSTPDAPAAIGPYSQAVRLGNLLYTSGQIALNPATGQVVSGAITDTLLLMALGMLLTRTLGLAVRAHALPAAGTRDRDHAAVSS